MTGRDYGPPKPYQLAWRTGHVETIYAHQVLLPVDFPLFGETSTDRRIKIHGIVDGQWQLILLADADDILSIRLLTSEEMPS